jgi:hypothetical protein
MSHLSIPLWVLLIAVVWALAIVNVKIDMESGGYGEGLAGCLGLLVAVIATLAVLLAHAWGWV